MKTRELSGAARDWAVAKCVGMRVYVGHNHTMTGPEIRDAELVDMNVDGNTRYAPSTDWAQGGPIIERGLIVISPDPQHGWRANPYMDLTEFYGPTPLVAAMRCYVASKLGGEVEIPGGIT